MFSRGGAPAGLTGPSALPEHDNRSVNRKHFIDSPARRTHIGEVNLCLRPRHMGLQHERLLASPARLDHDLPAPASDVITNRRIGQLYRALLIDQPVSDPFRGVALLRGAPRSSRSHSSITGLTGSSFGPANVAAWSLAIAVELERGPSVVDTLDASAATLATAGRGNRRAIPAHCILHGGTPGFTNLVVRKLDGGIQLDPHVDGSCLITLKEDSARLLFDVLREWLR